MKLGSRRAMRQVAGADNQARAGCANGPRFLDKRTGSAALVNSVVTPSQIGEDFIADRAHSGREVIDAHAVADESRQLSTPGAAFGKIADVHDEQVHRNATDNGATFAGDDDLGSSLALGGAGGAEKTVGITDRDNRNAGCPRGGPGCAVADGIAFADRAHLDDPGLELDHRTHGIFAGGCWVGAVERDARANQIAVNGTAEKYAGGIGQRG